MKKYLKSLIGGDRQMKLQQLYSHVRKAVDDYRLIDAGDKIAVGISGGKDSLTLLYALSGLRRFYPEPFELAAVTVDLGLEDTNFSAVAALCDALEVPYYVVHTHIGQILFEERRESSPCSLCAKMRKGALNEKAKEIGRNKIAYAHHMDDVIETALLSQLFEGRFYAFPPKTYFEDTALSVIRPMIYVTEAEVKGFRNKYDLPVVKNPCPVDGHTKRAYVKSLLRQINLEHPGVKTRLFHAICTGNIEGWTPGA